ncbi:Translin [Schizophyllum amplum]|uniref:Translin n=1 Tax=Schizophyllum amplum TaxID=97359 RepID=A0A550C794_9AGAR|nr:Translin [Auriculariopsis ampla]
MDAKDLDNINALLDQDVELREKIKDQVTELDKKTRTMTGLLNKIHSTPTSELPRLLDSVRPTLMSCSETTSALATIIPPNQFWRWKDMWSNSLRSIVFTAALMKYLTSGSLISIHRVEEILDVKEEQKDRFCLPPEDYLHGIISMVNELSRLAVNAVTLGNFEEPIRISVFVKDLFAGFSMLNLKNDTLRRRFDSLKYDLKKIEEVVYDVSLRKLAPSSQKEPSPAESK